MHYIEMSLLTYLLTYFLTYNSFWLCCLTDKPELLAVADEDGGVMILNTSLSGTQSIVQGIQQILYLFIC